MRRLTRMSGLVLWALAVVAAMVTIRESWITATVAHTLGHGAASYLQAAWSGFRVTVFAPYYWIALAVLSAAQWRWPAQHDHRGPSQAVAEDGAWFVCSTALTVTLLGACLAPLKFAYQHLTAARPST